MTELDMIELLKALDLYIGSTVFFAVISALIFYDILAWVAGRLKNRIYGKAVKNDDH
ncbi:hypothetical protein [Vibrio nigripulchritudo]|uniref:hypothetical protein n=1 Tax=Vibrio nigripulchritudo TaxID=28173 RepID=UPI0003B18FA4|nr:hypothetical protein [Vibrio nigripulchritudo]CCO41385.1 hypothetical protein VIBNISFn135_460001 [Vibrio nigripulchritudo SFn135]